MPAFITSDPDYQVFCEERLQNPYPLFHRLRAEDSVHWCAPLKCWLVTRYDDVLAGLRDPRLSSNRTPMYVQALSPELTQRIEPLLNHVSKWIQLTDEPDHARLRKLVNLAFTPKMINTLQSRILALTESLLDAVVPGRPFDIIATLGYPLPATIICEMLGIPTEQRDEFRRVTEQLMQFSTRGGTALKNYAPSAGAALEQLVRMFEPLVRERRRQPRDDLLSALAQAETDGDRLSNDELYAMCVFIFMAGHETTTNGIASGILALVQHPEQFSKLRGDVDAFVGGAVEETLRYESPVPRAVRLAKENLPIGDKRIQAGELVVLLLAAANRDPAQFPEPDRFDIARSPNRHVAFGYGTHFCLGAMLARLEMAIAFRVLVRRLPQLQLAAEPLTWKPRLGVRALETLPVTFSVV